MKYYSENDSQNKNVIIRNRIISPSNINPFFQKKKKKEKTKFAPSEYIEQILKGNIPVLSQAVTLIESQRVEHQAIAQEVIEKCLPYSGYSLRIGITGIPGSGKSTSIDSLGLYLLKTKNKKLAVLSIDPSSERSKGSILGDKTRMETLSRKRNVFIRPSPSAGSLGGVAKKTREIIILCEAAGFNTIFVETVGIGQSETAVHSMVDFFLLIQIAGAGDELQGIKRGVMEMADGIIVNKADGNNIKNANLTASQYRNVLNLFSLPPSGWIPQVITYSGYYGIGISSIWKMINKYVSFTKLNGFFDFRRSTQLKYWMYESINEQLKNHFYQNKTIAEELKNKEKQILDLKTSPFFVAKQMLDLYYKL